MNKFKRGDRVIRTCNFELYKHVKETIQSLQEGDYCPDLSIYQKKAIIALAKTLSIEVCYTFENQLKDWVLVYINNKIIGSNQYKVSLTYQEFITKMLNTVPIKEPVKVTISLDYDAVIHKDVVRVGYSTFTHESILNLASEINKFNKK